jgi:hypothetical protein
MVELEIATPATAEDILNLMERFYSEERYPYRREKARAALEEKGRAEAIPRVLRACRRFIAGTISKS